MRMTKAVFPGIILPLALAASACEDETTRLSGDLVTVVEATSAECPNGGGLVILQGTDVDTNGALSESEIASREVVCRGSGGTSGVDGQDGLTALLSASDEPAGVNCAEGGLRIDAGADANDNAVLDPDEVEQTSFVCDGPQGAPGAISLIRTRLDDGTLCENGGTIFESGVDLDGDGVLADDEVITADAVCAGAMGETTTSSITDEPPGANCSVGGSRIDIGVDADGSGTLEPSEISSTSYVCDPIRTVVRVSPELAATSTVCAGLGGSRIETGPDLDGDGVLDDTEITDTAFVCGGVDAGAGSLVAVTPEPAGMNCPAGGTRIDAGRDSDADGTLDPSEIVSTTYACNGVSGQNGGGGNAVRVSSEPAGANCPSGGVRIQSGPDTNGNGVLDDAEVTSTSFACAGTEIQTLVATQSEPAGANCANGGVRIDQGPDANDNGVLDVAEIASTQFVCNPTPSTAVPFAVTTTSLPNAFTAFPYDVPIEATGGTGGSYVWSVPAGTLPPGMSLATSGTPASRLAGTSTVAGSYSFTVRVTDFFGQTAEQSFTVEVGAPPCSPGDGTVVGEALTTLTSPTSFGSGITGAAADAFSPSAGGHLYVIDSGASLVQLRKDGSASTDLLPTLGLAGGVINTVHVIGPNIYLTNDAITCTSDCIRRISNDGGGSFRVVDLGSFATSPNDALQGVAEADGRLWMITNDTTDLQLWSLDLSASTFPTPARLEATYPDIDTCNGLEVDSMYFYSACDDIGNGAEGLIRIRRTTLVAEPVAELTLSISSGSWGGVQIADPDSDGIADVAYVQGDNNGSTTSATGATFYVCQPGGTVPAFAGPFGAGVGDDESLGYDPSTNSIYQIRESSSQYFRFD